MSVIVKDMKIPESCEECRMLTDAGFCSAKPKDFCGYASEFFLNRPGWCPLVELPEKHGRLIDEDEIIVPSLSSWADQVIVADAIQDAQTIIEAKGADE